MHELMGSAIIVGTALYACWEYWDMKQNMPLVIHIEGDLEKVKKFNDPSLKNRIRIKKEHNMSSHDQVIYHNHYLSGNFDNRIFPGIRSGKYRRYLQKLDN